MKCIAVTHTMPKEKLKDADLIIDGLPEIMSSVRKLFF